MSSGRDLRKRPAVVVAAFCLHACVLPQARVAPDAGHVVAFDATEFTDPHVDVSPDGSRLVFDVLGDLYTVPVSGGDATPLTQGSAWDISPRFSPDGKQIAFISDRGGARATIWTVDAAGGHPTGYRVAQPGWQSLTPRWAPDGSVLDIVWPSATASMQLRKFVTPGEAVPFPNPGIDGDLYFGDFSADGHYGYYGGKGLHRIDLRSRAIVDFETDPKAFAIEYPRISRSGEKLAYLAHAYDPATGETCTLHIRDLRTGNDRALRRMEGCSKDSYTMLPDGSAVVTTVAGKLTRIDTATASEETIPVRVHVRRDIAPRVPQEGRRIANGGEVSAKVIRWPRLSADGTDLVFDAFGKVYGQHLPGGKPARLTGSDDLEFAPALSPDGKWVAYTTSSGDGPGHLMVVAREGGTPRQLTTEPGRYINPAWSPDGTRIAFISDETEARFGAMPKILGASRGQWPLQLNWIPVGGGEAPHRILSTSTFNVESGPFHPVPVFAADGRRIFVPRYHLEDQGDPGGVELVAVDLDSGVETVLLRLPEADELVIAPDGRHAAVVLTRSLFVVPLPQHGAAEPLKVDPDTLTPIATDMPTQPSWQNSGTLVWATANELHRYRLESGAPEALTTLDVRHPRPAIEGCFALTGARLITMRGDEVIEDGTLVTCANRITAVGRTGAVVIPNGAQVIDAHGKTIIPGLIDGHGHFHHSPREIWFRQNSGYRGNLAFGVTTVFDPSAPTLDVFGQAELVEAGEVLGPRVYSSGAPIGPELRSDGQCVIRSLDEAKEIVGAYARFGAGPLKDYTLDCRASRQWLAQAARAAGVGLTSHPDPYPAVLTRIADGYAGIEHDIAAFRNGEGPLYDDVLQFVAESGVVYTRDGVGYLYSLDIDTADPKLRRFNTEQRLKAEKALVAPSTVADARRINTRDARAMRRVSDFGGRLSISAHGNGVPGLALHWQLWALVEDGGMTPLAALRAGTIDGAVKIGLAAELGSIEPGKAADFVVLDANPLENIRNSSRVRYVVRGGFVYDGDTLEQIWPAGAVRTQ